MKITKLTTSQVNKQSLSEIKELLVQLGVAEPRLTSAHLKKVISDPKVTLLTVRDGARIIGIGSLYIFDLLEKRSGFLEEIIVHSDYQRQGLGEALVKALIAEARKKKVARVDLTSRPSRVGANKLYQKVGFVERETNVYRLVL